ncbi:HGR018Cp [Eremothecium sinecaudum]|uniref:HGR018Cp n=1 Tax=Eremothecium sinecaudum TaxID=45286 RepID=A0A0X8HVM4_9SACH|nr:HGR018Cp [Eremothecium sinecaudum]AMD22357.1 HGR018Cp [Eremothecium sinecaudum]
MSRLRRFNDSVLKFSQNGNDDRRGSHYFDEVDFLPLDTDEQEQLIQKIELSNSTKNDKYLRRLGFLYLLCGGGMLALATAMKMHQSFSKYRLLLLVSVQSIGCSFVYLRYSAVWHILQRFRIPFNIDSRAINIINMSILLTITWVVSGKNNNYSALVLLHIPHLLFIIAILVTRWVATIDTDIKMLRSSKYKFKNA